MASALRHDFKAGAIAILKGAFVNRVARFCSFLIGADGIDVTLVENPSGDSPNVIRLNATTAAPRIYQEMLRMGVSFGGGGSVQGNTYDQTGSAAEKLAKAQALAAQAPKAPAILDEIARTGRTSKQIADAAIARIGTSAVASRADHVHPSVIRSNASSGMSTSQLTTLAGHAPKAASIQKTTETDAQKIARLGTSSYAAREDHVHPIPREDTSSVSDLGSGPRNNRSTNTTTAKTNTWDRNTATAGFKLKVMTRTWSSGGVIYSLFRTLTFDKYGALVYVSGETWGDYMREGY